jgi:uncharacterized protein YndB with AHSA1/START domain
MSGIKTRVRAVSDLVDGQIVASVELATTPERVFQALASREVVDWWVNPGVFDTREWTGDVRIGGRWRASGIARGTPYALEGEFLEVDPPRRLVQTWHFAGAPGVPSTVTYLLEPIAGGTRLTVHHAGLAAPDQQTNVGAGWRSSFDRLAEILSADHR